MRKLLLVLFVGLISPAIQSQAPSAGPIKMGAGSAVTYHSGMGNDAVDVILKVLSMDQKGVTLEYTVSHGNNSFTGKINVPHAGVMNGLKLNWDDLAPGKNNTIPGDETSFFFSTDFYHKLLANKKANYNSTVYTLEKMPTGQEVMIDGKPVETLYIESTETHSRYWILKDPSFPLILKMAGNQGGPSELVATKLTV